MPRHALDSTVVSVAATTTVVNLNTEQTLFSLSVPGLSNVSGGLLEVVAGGTITNNSSGAVTYTFRFKIGGTTVLTTDAVSVAQSANARKWAARFTIAYETSSAQRVSGVFDASTPNTTTMPAISTGTCCFGYGTAAEDMTVAKSVIWTVQMGTADSLANCVLAYAHIRRVGS